jgi:hypothetical protein
MEKYLQESHHDQNHPHQIKSPLDDHFLDRILLLHGMEMLRAVSNQLFMDHFEILQDFIKVTRFL